MLNLTAYQFHAAAALQNDFFPVVGKKRNAFFRKRCKDMI
jgi:hypothetical protein